MEQRYRKVRKELDDLGYMQILIPESIPLVDKIIGDLIQTTESLKKYKQIAQEALEERDKLQIGIEPFKCDNAKLVKECNDLHLAFLQYREQSDKTIKDLKCHSSNLERQKIDCDFECEKLRQRIRNLEFESAKKTDRILTFQNKNPKAVRKTSAKSSTTSILKSKSGVTTVKGTEFGMEHSTIEHKIANLTKEVNKLKDEQLHLIGVNDTLKSQLSNRDREIERLNRMLQGGRPLDALNKDCCCKDFDGKMYKMQNEICCLQKEKSDVEVRLKESITKQHEAMERALHLAERGRQLEQELHDIDKMALAVESDCNARVQDNSHKVFRLEEKVHDTVLQIQTLEREVMELKREKQALLSDVDACKLEKKQLQAVLETALDEKKRLNDRLNQLNVIEHDLNLEIDRLVQTSSVQKRKISELECKVVAGKFDATTNVLSAGSAEHYRSERDYYMKEYYKLLEKKTEKSDISELQRKLNEKEQLLSTLQHDNKTLAQEKHNLMIRLENLRDRADDNYDNMSIKSSARRLERERDLLKGDILRLEEERDAIRQRLRVSSETQASEQMRIQANLRDADDRISQLEQERRELIQTQGSRRATITNLEEQCKTLNDQLHLCQTELNQQRALYTQLKTLHEQTDKALADSLGQLAQLEGELSNSQKEIRSLESLREMHAGKTESLKNENAVLKESLSKIDYEKDNLLISVDDKTERVAMLEQELRSKDSKIEILEKTSNELKKKLSITMDHTSSKEQLLRTASYESATLRQEIDGVIRSKESALLENRRLQDELAACTTHYRAAQHELEMTKRQVDDLKRQLQHYVAEVKRFEDLMSNKELERTELLDQFKSLSQDAIELENNNHTLETEATQSKVQLSVTLDHVADLEHRLLSQEEIITTYEKKLTESATHIADIDNKVAHYRKQHELSASDLTSLRELCMRLDKQKEMLIHDLNAKEEQRSHIDRDITRLQIECETLRTSLAKDRNAIENLERLLSESRQETVKHKIMNDDLEAEIRKLKQRIEDLQSRISTTSHPSDTYQPQTFQYNRCERQYYRDTETDEFCTKNDEVSKRYPSL